MCLCVNQPEKSTWVTHPRSSFRQHYQTPHNSLVLRTEWPTAALQRTRIHPQPPTKHTTFNTQHKLDTAPITILMDMLHTNYSMSLDSSFVPGVPCRWGPDHAGWEICSLRRHRKWMTPHDRSPPSPERPYLGLTTANHRAALQTKTQYVWFFYKM